MNLFNSNNSLVLASGERLTIPVIAEQAEVQVQQEHTGTVRVRKLIHQDETSVESPLFRERVETTRVPVNQVVESAQSPTTLGDVLVIPVYEERLVKQLVLVEEIHVRRRRESVEQTIPVALRREEVVVERLDVASGQWVADRT